MLLSLLKELDKKIFLYCNGLHSDEFDILMYSITQNYYWIPLYVLLLYLIIKTHNRKAVGVIIGIVITITLCDQVTSSIMKPYFLRLRPSQEPSLTGLVHLVNGYTGGLYGFASSHAANTFGIAMYLWLTLREKTKWIGLIFIWCSLVSYSRIYLGVHYPSDILVGACLGLFISSIVFSTMNYIEKKSSIFTTR